MLEWSPLKSFAPIPRLSEIGNERQGFFESANFEAIAAKLPEYLRDFTRFGFLTGWRKGSIESLRWSDVGDGIACVLVLIIRKN